MAPLCSDPRQIVINLEPARRRALLRLVTEITTRMIAELDSQSNDLGPIATEDESSSGSQTPQAQNDDGQQPRAPKPAAEQTKPKSSEKASKEAMRIQQAAVKHMAEWQQEFIEKLGEIVSAEDDAKIVAERKKRAQELQKRGVDHAEEGEDLMSFGDAKVDKSEDFYALQMLYQPLPTNLTSSSIRDRKEALSCILLLLLSTGKYSAHSRVLGLYLASSLELPQTFVIHEETEIAKTLMESSNVDEKDKQATMSAETDAAKKRQENKFGRYWKVGLASVAGAAVIGVTGGLAAPLVAGALGGVLGGIGLGGVASFLGIFWMNGALVGALFGAYGAKMTGEMMDKYAKEVEDFKFIPLQEEWGKDYSQETKDQQQNRRLRLTIGINGWLNEEADIVKPWRALSTETEVFALRYEMKTLIALGTAFSDLVKSAAWNTFKSEVIKRTVFATLWAALWPIQVLAAASNVDNPFSQGLNRSRKAGKLLADALINKVQGERPVTLIGYSLGAAAIHACLQTLAERRAFGLIESVVIIGAPAPAASSHWRTLRTVVSGKIFNVYSENDMILGFVYRMYSLSMGVAGLQAIKNVDGIENLDLSDVVSGHQRYPELTGEILRKCAFVGIKASNTIEKDEVIQMKNDFAEGKLVDLDGEQDSEKKTHSIPRKEVPKGDVADDLRGLNISPPALDPKSEGGANQPKTEQTEEESLPLPPRPDGTVPTDKESSVRDEARPVTPTSTMSDDEEFHRITMKDNGSP
ncbi:uncharacterized protein F5Z01DRAFT_535654 [Emericellopsis atlantica]|uniref:Uncharacterized protein n=1 Tax=Emericellopsis atlantica TaxID=2614577 RepID=A0A9P8CR84_9HYPO|nr:uncharacterized protein F5Z01DRAFT_535654 [Emericellopsis atlantica]KAG9256047.1 hypothetical protein F5Z01DRAFT_535654 [Emericellopsis atlantica]